MYSNELCYMYTAPYTKKTMHQLADVVSTEAFSPNVTSSASDKEWAYIPNIQFTAQQRQAFSHQRWSQHAYSQVLQYDEKAGLARYHVNTLCVTELLK